MGNQRRLNNQVVANIGLYYTCYCLSRNGWNVMPTSLNARGIDLLAYNHDASRIVTIQVKALSRRNPVPLGNKLDHLFADFVAICRNVLHERPECFILTPKEICSFAHRREKGGKVNFWLQTREYEQECFRENWHRIGYGYPD